MTSLLALLCASALTGQGTLPLTEPKQPPLIAVIQQGDLETATQLLKNGVSPNCFTVEISLPSGTRNSPGGRLSSGDSALEIAVQRRSVKITTLLLQYKADPNIRSRYGWTPLMAASQSGQHALVNLLLKNGAKPNLLNEYGEAAICYAANMGSTKCVAALLDAGADPYAGKTTALEMAVQSSATEMVRFLLQRKVDPNRTRKGANTPLEQALLAQNEEVASMLRKAGGKARPIAVLEKEQEAARAKWQKEWCQRHAAVPKRDASRARLLPEDAEVFQAVLTRMTKEVWKGKNAEPIFINPVSTSRHDPEEQMNSELPVSKALELTLDLRSDWLDRTSVDVSLGGLTLKDSELGTVKDRSDNQRSIAFHLPGYSADGRRALVRFWFGPSSHGAAGTAFVEKSATGFVVMWIEFAYYA